MRMSFISVGFPPCVRCGAAIRQQVMIPTPGQPDKHSGSGAVNSHTGETVVQLQRHQRRREIAQLLEALLENHAKETIYVAWDHVSTQEGDEGEEVLKAPAGCVVLLFGPTHSPWLNPIEMRLQALSAGSHPW